MADFDETLATALKALKANKDREWSFALLAKGAAVAKLVVDKKPIKSSDLAAWKREVKATASMEGTVVQGEGKRLVFRVAEPPIIAEEPLRRYLVDAAWLQFDPVFEQGITAEALAAGKKQLKPATERNSSEPAHLELIAARQALQSRILAIVQATPEHRDELKSLSERFKRLLQDQDEAGAREVLATLTQRVDEYAPATAPRGPETKHEWASRIDLQRYKVGKQLGKGAFGTVNQLVPQDPGAPPLVAKFGDIRELEKELSIYEKVGEHPNLAKCLGIREVGGKPALVLEEVRGDSLQIGDAGSASMLDRLAELWRLQQLTHEEYWGTVQYLLTNTFRGLAVVHEAGLVHSDVKHGNVMVDYVTGDVKVVDLGGAVASGSKRRQWSSEWQAPESRKGPYLAEDKYDVWATGKFASQSNLRSTRQGQPKRPPAGGDPTRESAYAEFVRLVTHPDPSQRLSARDALLHPFLSDPLMSEEGARGVLRRGQPDPQLAGQSIRALTPEAWTANWERAIAGNAVRTSASGPSLAPFVREGAERVRELQGRVEQLFGLSRKVPLENRSATVEEVGSALEAFLAWSNEAVQGFELSSAFDDSGVFEAYNAGADLVDLARNVVEASVPLSTTEEFAEAWASWFDEASAGYLDALNHIAEAHGAALVSEARAAGLEPWLEEEVDDEEDDDDVDEEAWGRKRSESLLAARGVSGVLEDDLGLAPTFGEQLKSFDAAGDGERRQLAPGLVQILARSIERAGALVDEARTVSSHRLHKLVVAARTYQYRAADLARCLDPETTLEP